MRSRLAAERLDPGVLGAAEVEQVVGLRVLGGDGVEHAADERCRRRRGAAGRGTTSATARGRAGPSRPGRPRTRARRSARIRSGVRVSERIVWRIFAANSVAPEAALALARRQDDVAQVGLERGRGRPRAVGGRGSQARLDRGDAGSVGAAPSAARQRVGDELLDAGSCFSAVSVWNRPTGRPACADERCRAPRRARPAASRGARPSTPADRPAARTRGRCSVNRPSPRR